MTDTRTVKGWASYLQIEDAQLTLEEFAALVLIHIRENVKDSREGTQHLEAMVGSIDEMLSATNPLYQQIAARRSQPVATCGQRAAIRGGPDGSV